MSQKINCKYIQNFNREFEKNSKFIEGKLIRYSKDGNELYEVMKVGYLQMAKINLENSEPLIENKREFKYEFDTINEYEKWLCGV